MAKSRNRVDYVENDTVLTPKYIFDALALEFDLDVASSKSVYDEVNAKKRFTIENDGLAQPWNGLVWCNPPYSNCSPWVDRMIEHNNGIALLPASKSRWGEKVFARANGMLMLPPNFKFVGTNGEPKPIYMPVYLYSFGDRATKALLLSGLGIIR